MEDKLINRIKTIAELRLMELDVHDYLKEADKEYGNETVDRAIKRMGLWSVLRDMRK